jgi:hypothetical protein
MAQLQGHIQPQMPNLGPIIAAFLQYRQAQEKERQQQVNSLLSSAGKLAGGIGQMQQQGQAYDAANAAIYPKQFPNDPYGGFVDPNRVPDYGGTDALRSMRYAGEFGNSSQVQPPQLITLPNGQRFLWSPTSGGVHPLSAGGQSPDNDDVLKAAKAIVDNYTKANGITSNLLTSKTAVHSGKDASGNDVPEGMYRIDIPESAKEDAHTIDVSAAEFDSAHKALDQMNAILNARLAGGSTGASTYTPGMGDPRMEGGRLDATGHPAVSYQLSPTGATFAVKPGDPRFGLRITATNPDGKQVTGTATDFGPGVKNVDIASSNPAEAKSSPFDNAVVTPTPQDAGKGLQPGTQRTVLGVTYVWTGHRWNPVK